MKVFTPFTLLRSSRRVSLLLRVFRAAWPLVYLLPLALCAAPAFATTRTVTTTADETDPNDGVTSLREAIAASGSGDTVNFGVTGAINLTLGELAIGRNLTITGPASGITVQRSTASGTPNFRILDITAGTVSISNLTISNGSLVGANGTDGSGNGVTMGAPAESVQGGGILNNGTLTLTNCVVSGNTAVGGNGGQMRGGGLAGESQGGGIYSAAGTALTLTNCTVATNTAAGGVGNESGGAGGAAEGGAVFCNSGTTLTATNCTFHANTVTAGAGGQGLDVSGGTGGAAMGGFLCTMGSFTLLDCTVDSNTVTAGAGGVCLNAGGGGGMAAGGGVFAQSSATSSATNCTFSDNTAHAGAGQTPMEFEGGSGGNAQGGQIDSTGNGTIVLANCTLSGGAVSGGTGGAAGGANDPGIPGGVGGSASGGNIFVNPTSLKVLNTLIAVGTVTGGTGGANGGPGASSSAANGTATGPDVDGTATSQGHNLVSRMDGSTGWIASDMTGTVATPLDPGLGMLGNNGGPTPTLPLLSSSVAIDAGDDAVLNAPTSVAADQRGFPRKLGAHVDIGAFEYDPPQTGNSLVVNTLADHDDGVAGQGDCTLREAIHAANGNSGTTTITFKSGLTGTISLLDSGLSLTASASINGPGARVLTVNGIGSKQILNVGASSTLTISGLTFSHGTANQGGAIFNQGSLTLNNCAFDSNTAHPTRLVDMTGGHAIYSQGTLNANNCTFSRNTLSGTIQSNDSGGAIHVAKGMATFTNCTFSGNTAGTGGAIFNAATLTLSDCTVNGNRTIESAQNGGGGGIWTSSTATLNDTLVAGNSAISGGDDLHGAFTTGGYNFIGQSDGTNGLTNGANGDQVGTTSSALNPMLDTLKNNGGPTDTMALLSGSAAIDRGKSFTLTTDQRGFHRPSDFSSIPNASGGDGSDIGAYEVQPPPATPSTLKATAGFGSVALTWSAASGASSYNVKRSATAGGPYSTIASPASTSFIDTSVTGGVTYFYVVSAVSNGSESGNSNEASATPIDNTFHSVDVTVATDNSARLLWGRADGTGKLISYSSSGTATPGTSYGPNTGWTPRAMAAGADKVTRILWTNSNGMNALWLLNLSNLLTKSFLIGSGPGTGYTAVDVTVGSDSKARVLWTAANGFASLFSMDNTGTVTAGPTNGPNAGWTARRIAAGSDGLTRILWTQANGPAAIWLMNANNTLSKGFTIGSGPGSGWTAVDVTVGTDNLARVLWEEGNGFARVDSVDNTGKVTAGKQYGPNAGWMAKGIAAGSDGITRLHWVNANGSAGLWLLNAANTQTGGFVIAVPTS